MNRLLVPLVVLMAAGPAFKTYAQAPRLVVMLTVEGLRTDILEATIEEPLSEILKKDQTQIYSDVRHPLLKADAASSMAILHTGTTAAQNGIPARKPILRDAHGRINSHQSVFFDTDYIGYATADRLSPQALTAATISDKLKSATQGLGLVYSIASNAEEAIIGGGQYANGVFWIDNSSERWASSTYYQDGKPWYVDKTVSPSAKLDKGVVWSPLYQANFSERYGDLIPYPIEQPFSYPLSRNNSSMISYKGTPLINEEVTQLALALLESSGLGRDKSTDFLSLHYTVEPTKGDCDLSPEVLDSYYRFLDEIKKLKKRLPDSSILIISGDAMALERIGGLKEQRTFYINRCLALTNMYLAAEYGQKGLVKEITQDGQVFLNQVEGVNSEELETAVANFLLEFSGVQYALTNTELKRRSLSEERNRAWQTSLNISLHKHRGDVIFGVLPGWIISQDDTEQSVSPSQAPVASPLFISGPNVSGGKHSEPIDLRYVSNIICHTLRIRPPTP